MLRQLVTVTAAVALLAGCGGNDDNTSDSKPEGSGDATTASTPSAPAVASFDPPKGFVVASAFGVDRTPKDNNYTLHTGMVGQTSLLAGLTGVTGRNIAAQGEPWTVPSAEASTTQTVDLTAPMAVQLDGKDVVAMAYIQFDEGNGTQKAKGQVLFQWLDATDGKKVAEVTTDLTPALGPGEGGDNVVSQVYDAATGQVAIGVSPGSEAAGKKAGSFTVYADPKTQKSTVIPFVQPAGVLNGIIAGAKAGNGEGVADGTIVVADAVSGRITKQTPLKQDYLFPAGNGTKRACLTGHSYVKAKPGTFDGTYNNVLYSVDIATGSVVQLKGQYVKDSMNYTCLGDQANAVVCTGKDNNEKLELLGLDDTTGKKTWGYTSESANRVIPDVTAAFHGIVYAQTDAQAVLMDAATGNDVPTSTPTPSESVTPSDGVTPTEGSTPTEDPSSQGKDPGSANGSDLSLYNGKMKSPVAVTQCGGTYLQETGMTGFISVLIALAPTA